MDRDQEEFYIVTYFCSVISFLSIQHQHPYPKIRRVGEKSLEQKERLKKEASQEMSSLEHSYRKDTDSDEELPSLEFIQNVQDHCQNVSEQTISEESVDSTTGSSSIIGTPALNVERPETKPVELETSRVPENLIVPEKVSPSVETAEDVSCQAPPAAAAEKVLCKPIRSPRPQRSRRPPPVFTCYAPGYPMYDAQVNHVNCINPHMSETPLIPQYQLPALAPTLPVLYIFYRIPIQLYFHSPAGYLPAVSAHPYMHSS